MAGYSFSEMPVLWNEMNWVIGLIASTTLSAETPSCAPNLDHLTYPAVALAARIQATVNMSFTVGADGKATGVDSNSYPLLRAGVEPVLRATSLAPQSSGKRITIQVNFLIAESDVPNPVLSVDRVSEMVWQVKYLIPILVETTSDPARTFTRSEVLLCRVRRWFSKL